MFLRFFAFFVLGPVCCLGKVTDLEYDRMPDVFLYDDYDKCLFHSLEDDPLYCMVTVQLLPEGPGNSSAVWNTIQEVNKGVGYRHDLLRRGICTTKICRKNEDPSRCLDRIYKSKHKDLNLSTKLLNISCENQNTMYPSGSEDVVFIVLLGLYVVFVLAVSVWSEIVKYKFNRKKDDETKNPPAFSIFEHVRYIFDKGAKGSSQNYVMFIQTMRFGVSSYIILLHTALLMIATPVLNVKRIEKEIDSFFARLQFSGSMIVSIFFVISSWLLTFNFFQRLKKTKDISFGYVLRSIFKRYIRLTSGQILFLVLHRTWFVRLDRGYFWDTVIGEDYKNCKEKWWMNLLYINNFFINDGICLPHTWYLSVEFQFTVLGLIILWLTQKNPKSLFIAAGSLLIFQTTFLFAYLTYNNYKFALQPSVESYYNLGMLKSPEWHATWSSTYSNLPGLASGLCFGYLSYRYQNTQIITKNIHRISWWLLTLSSTLGIIFFTAYYLGSEYYTNNPWLSAAYGSVNKVIFLLGVGLFIFGMSQGLGGVLRNIFDWNPMHTMGQLSFGAYVVHVSFLLFEGASRKSPCYMSNYGIVTQTVKNISLAYLLSFVLTSFVLMPIDALSKKLI